MRPDQIPPSPTSLDLVAGLGSLLALATYLVGVLG